MPIYIPICVADQQRQAPVALLNVGFPFRSKWTWEQVSCRKKEFQSADDCEVQANFCFWNLVWIYCWTAIRLCFGDQVRKGIWKQGLGGQTPFFLLCFSRSPGDSSKTPGYINNSSTSAQPIGSLEVWNDYSPNPALKRQTTEDVTHLNSHFIINFRSYMVYEALRRSVSKKLHGLWGDLDWQQHQWLANNI